MKLFVTDLDGSLLNSNKELPLDFYTTINTIKNNNDLFFIASGRSKNDIRKLFDEKEHFHNYICDNGALVMYENNIIYHNYMNRDDIRKIIDIFYNNDLGVLVLSGIKDTYRIYGKTCHPKDAHFFERYYVESLTVKSIDDIPEEILKITIQSYQGAGEFIAPYYKDCNFIETSSVVAGLYWFDFTNSSATKGEAIKSIQKTLGISKDDSHCFGDYLNDLSMKDYCTHSYAMANSHQTILDEFSEVIDSNDNCGVTKKINEIMEK